MCRELGFASLRARTLQLLGIARVDLGDLKAARAALQEGLPVSVDLGDRFVIPVGLSGFAGLAAKSGKHRMALRLAAAAQAYRDACETALPEPEPGVPGQLASAVAQDGRRRGAQAACRGPADDADGGCGVRAGQRARGNLAGRARGRHLPAARSKSPCWRPAA